MPWRPLQGRRAAFLRTRMKLPPPQRKPGRRPRRRPCAPPCRWSSSALRRSRRMTSAACGTLRPAWARTGPRPSLPATTATCGPTTTTQASLPTTRQASPASTWTRCRAAMPRSSTRRSASRPTPPVRTTRRPPWPWSVRASRAPRCMATRRASCSPNVPPACPRRPCASTTAWPVPPG